MYLPIYLPTYPPVFLTDWLTDWIHTYKIHAHIHIYTPHTHHTYTTRPLTYTHTPPTPQAPFDNSLAISRYDLLVDGAQLVISSVLDGSVCVPQYLLANLIPGTAHTFSVRAVNSAGQLAVPTAHCSLLTAHHPLLTAPCPLPCAHCLMLSAHCPLSTVH